MGANSGGDFLGALQDAVRENPISAALIGMGVFWMFMGGRNVSLFGGGGSKSIFGTAAQGAEQFAGAARNAGASMGASVNQATQAMKRPAWQTGSNAATATDDAASRTAARAADAAVSGYQAATEMASRTIETMSNATTTAASALQETTGNWSRGVQGTLSDVLERQPLLLGALGIAIGAGIAASVPITETEQKVMGEASDLVREKVSEKAAEVTGQMNEIADAALSEAKAQGITPEKMGEVVQAIGSKMTGEKAIGVRSGSSGGSSFGGQPWSSRKN
jgi:hypothetical protein